MLPCLEGEGCDLLINRSGWTCTQPGGRIKTTTVCTQPPGWPGVRGFGGAEQAGRGGPHTGDSEKAAPGFLTQGGCQLCGHMGLSPGCSEHQGVTEGPSAREATQSTSRPLSPHKLVGGGLSCFGGISFQPQAAGKVGTHRGASDPTSGQMAFKRKERGAVGLMQVPPRPQAGI